MKTRIKTIWVALILMLALSKANAHRLESNACQNGTAMIIDSNVIGSVGQWNALSGNPTNITIDSPTSFRIHVTGFSLSGQYLIVWTGTGISDTAEIQVQASPPAPGLSALGSCVGSDSLLLSGLSGVDEINWFLNGAIVHSTLFPAHPAVGGNGSGSALNQINYAGSITMDGVGNLYVADWGNSRILKFPRGSNSSTYGIVVAGGNGNGNGANQFRGATAVYVDTAGYIYVSDNYNNRVQRFPPSSTSVTNGTTIAGGNGSGSAANQLSSPEGITGDAAGNIYVADYGNYRVQKFLAGSTSASNGLTVAGGNGSGSAANQLNAPWSVMVDTSGNLYVSDDGNDRVQMFPANSTSTTNGITVAGGNGHGAGANQLSYPSGIYLNSANELYVIDYGNYRVQKFPAGSTSATNGVTVAGGNGSGSASNQMKSGVGIAVDTSGNIFVFDEDNYRVQEYTFGSIDSVYRPVAPGYYTASILVNSGCRHSLSDSVLIPICTDSVWPGDADNNYLVDNLDLLPIGLAYDSIGPVRPVQGIVWQADSAADWSNQFSQYAPLVNFKTADCNGDGIVDANDTMAININYEDWHTKTSPRPASWRSGIPGIAVHYSKDTVVAGDTLITTLTLGDTSVPVSNIYGLAFTFHYDPLPVDSTTSGFDFDPTSWFGSGSNTISIAKDLKTTGTVQAAITGIDHRSRSGSGVLAKFRAIITTGNINGKNLKYHTSHAFISDITAIDAGGNRLQLNAGQDSNKVGYVPTGIAETEVAASVRLYPNPANTKVIISTHVNINGITFTDMLGQEVWMVKTSGKTTESIDISKLDPGIYILHVSTTGGSGIARLVIGR